MVTEIDDLSDLLGRIKAVSGDTLSCRDIEGLLAESRTALSFAAEDLRARAASAIRKLWLSLAHSSADRTIKSPPDGVCGNLPGGQRVAFGYERDLDVGALEQRGDRYLPCPAGLSSATVIFRSGQSALSGLLQFAIMNWTTESAVSLAHCGTYFETVKLVQKWPRSAIRLTTEDEAVDVVIAEPVWCDGQFGITEAHEAPRAARLLIIDTTLVSHDIDLAPWMKRLESGAICVLMRSGLKLDQAGLELANVGILRVFGTNAKAVRRFVSELTELRGLNGSGLTFDEMSALSATWFMDPVYAADYAGKVFRNNAALATAIGHDSPVFQDKCHPSLVTIAMTAPFCCLRLRRNETLAGYEKLMGKLERESERRGLRFEKGGSFGFRGHRYELVQPEDQAPFMRIAMGSGSGASQSGICEMVGQLARGNDPN